MNRYLFVILLVTLNLIANAHHALSPIYNNLGSYTKKISTVSPKAQRFFNQGLNLFYGFEWADAERSFDEAIRLDPKCAMCHWGKAISLTYKVNAPMSGNEFKEAAAAIREAKKLAAQNSPLEQGIINALALRLEEQPNVKKVAKPMTCHNNPAQDDKQSLKAREGYSKALRELMQQHPNDVDIKVLYAAEQFWNMEDPKHKQRLQESSAILEPLVATAEKHPGVHHYVIHINEATKPQKAIRSADILTNLVPDSEHLMHMPSHIYLLTGRYHEASIANTKAIQAYERYNNMCRKQGFKPLINYLFFHNYDFLRSAAAMEGRSALTIQAAKRIMGEPLKTWIKNEEGLQWFIPIGYFAYDRFAKWKEVLELPKPKVEYEYARGMWHYSQGLAEAGLNKPRVAAKHEQALAKIISDGPIDENLGETGLKLLKIADHILKGRLADKKGMMKEAIRQVKSAAKIQDGMGYHEPPDWYFPVKQVLGDLYLKWGEYKLALQQYDLDLKQYPNNGWSLYGKAKAYRALKQDKEADEMKNVFKVAWQRADVQYPPSIF